LPRRVSIVSRGRAASQTGIGLTAYTYHPVGQPGRARSGAWTGRSRTTSSRSRACPIELVVPWVFKGTRLPVATVIENLEELTVDEVMEQFDVTREQVTAVLEFVADCLRSEAPAGARPV
jgi:hypothetical protein